MLRISKLADYATVIMSYLSQSDSARNAAEIAQKTGVPLPTARKILKQLTQAKLLMALRGAEGGYQLNGSGDRISLGQVIETIDGPLALTQCCALKNDCQQESSCHTKDHWQVINQVVRDALYKVHLTNLSRQASEMTISLPISRKRGLHESNQ